MAHAAGAAAVVSALRHGLREMGVRRTFKSLRMVNQNAGFHCIGCAWSDPAKRHHAKFCENAAKAVAWWSEQHTLHSSIVPVSAHSPVEGAGTLGPEDAPRPSALHSSKHRSVFLRSSSEVQLHPELSLVQRASQM